MQERQLVRFHFDPVWNRAYLNADEIGGRLARLLKGLSRILDWLDRIYERVPFKRVFAQMMEAV